MGPLGVQETVFIFVLALLIFGPRKLPELGKTIGKAMSEFRRASSELRATFDREMNAIERENESLKDVTRQYALEEHSYSNDSYYDSGDYGSGSYDYNSADHTSVSASAPQGADDQAGQHQTVAVDDEHGTKPAETASVVSEDQAAGPAHAPATETAPHSVKS
jgi:TatA/E family protein of Tat protein translocase